MPIISKKFERICMSRLESDRHESSYRWEVPYRLFSTQKSLTFFADGNLFKHTRFRLTYKTVAANSEMTT